MSDSKNDNAGSGGRRPRPGYLFVVPWRPGAIGGVNTVVRNLYRYFEAEDRYTPAVMVESWSDLRVRQTVEDGMDLLQLRLRPPVVPEAPIRSRVAYAAEVPLLLPRLVGALRSRNVRVINSHYPTLGTLNFTLARQLGLTNAKLVLSMHGTDVVTTAQSSGPVRRYWNRLLRDADAIVTCSQALAQEAAQLLPGLESKISVAYNGLDADQLESGRDAGYTLPAELRGREFVLSVAAFEARKGHDVLLPAFAKVARLHPEAMLVLIGQVGPEFDKIKALVSNLGLDKSCLIFTDIPPGRVARYMEAARVFVLASKNEPFGLVVLEAGAHGLPVVASRVGGIPEIICSPEYGTLVRHDDPEAFAQAISAMLANPDRAHKLGWNLRQRVLTQFPWKVAYQAYLGIAG